MNAIVLSPSEHASIEKVVSDIVQVTYIWRNNGLEVNRLVIEMGDANFEKLAWSADTICQKCFVTYGVFLDVWNCACGAKA